MSKLLSYRELSEIRDFDERFEYLKLGNGVGEETFGHERYLNQRFYRSAEWRRARRDVIARDLGSDLAHPDYPIFGKVLVHHLNPIDKLSLQNRDDLILDLDNLVCVSHLTHNAIHYGSSKLLPKPVTERFPGDTKLW